jgi:transposase
MAAAGQIGLDLPKAGAACSRARRESHPTLAHGEMATHKKGGLRDKASIAFIDESGFMLQPLCCRTWAPRGETPIQNAWDRHDRLSAIGALTASPQGRRLNLYFQLLPHNVQTDDMVWFLTQMHRHFRHRVIVVWDRSSVHRSAAAHFQRHHSHWFQFEWLPSYAPELNPIEQCWNHTKHHDLPNFIPKDIKHLESAVLKAIRQQSANRVLLRSFFKYSQLGFR